MRNWPRPVGRGRVGFGVGMHLAGQKLLHQLAHAKVGGDDRLPGKDAKVASVAAMAAAGSGVRGLQSLEQRGIVRDRGAEIIVFARLRRRRNGQ